MITYDEAQAIASGMGATWGRPTLEQVGQLQAFLSAQRAEIRRLQAHLLDAQINAPIRWITREEVVWALIPCGPRYGCGPWYCRLCQANHYPGLHSRLEWTDA